VDPFSQLSQLQQNLQAMTKTVAGLENDMLEVLKENTELKVENQLLREKISKLDANKEPAESKSQAGLKSLRNIYDSGYHICNMYYGSHRESGEDCMFCLDILDNFVNHGQKNRG
jgi:regulator of replication initiation timing